MYNELEYDLVELDLPNIIYAHRKGEASKVKTETHPFLVPLLVKLAKARPKWKLVGTRYNVRPDNVVWANAFTVFEGNEELGTIKKDYNHGTGSDCFAIDNKRMADKRQRGSATTTKDVKKAFKTITREFHGLTTEELLREARGAANLHVANTERDRRNTYQLRISAMREAALAFALDNWDAFTPFAREQGVPGIMLDTFHEAKEQNDEAQRLNLAHSAHNAGGSDGLAGMLVVLRGNDYIIQRGGKTLMLTQDQLTSHMRRCIGMLKLTEKGTFVPDIGIKTGEDQMFIMPETKETECE